MIGDWTFGLIIAACGIAWVYIFADYRKKLSRVMSGVQKTAARRLEFDQRIAESESHTRDLLETLEGLAEETKDLDLRRRDLQHRLNEKEMVRIPAGRFGMGSNAPGRDDENPEHEVHLEAFYIDKFEVTNVQYKDFIDVTGHRAPVHWRNRSFSGRLGDHPVTNVSWEDAQAYAEWAGKRLPSEAEWEYAARGDTEHDYPWGNTCSAEHLNFLNPEGNTTSVGKYPRGVSPFGVWDMCGNVGEWVSDWYDPTYYRSSPTQRPTGPEEGKLKVYRGGGYHGNRQDVRACARHPGLPQMAQQYIGFRCAMDASA